MNEPQVGQLDIERLDNVAVVGLLGEHDLSTAPALRENLLALIEEGCGVVADLSDAEFIDVAVVRALLDCDEALRGRERRLALQLGTGCLVGRLFELAELRELFAFAQDRVAAVDHARTQHEGGEPR